jgi:uncharacterized membrane protein
MFKSKWILFLVILLVIFIGLTIVTMAVSPDGIILVRGAEVMRPVCGSTCSI